MDAIKRIGMAGSATYKGDSRALSVESLELLSNELLGLTGACGWISRNGHNVLRWRGCPEDIFGVNVSLETTLDEIISIFSPSDRANLRKAVIACLNRAKPWTLELKRPAGKERRVWLHASGKAVDINGVRHIVGVFRNVSHVKQMETELAQESRAKAIANEMLSQLLDVVPDAIAAYAPDDRLIFFNKQYRTFYSKAAPAIRIGQSYEVILRHAVENGQYMCISNRKKDREEWMKARLEQHRRGMHKDLVQQLADGRWVQVRERKSSSGYTVFVSTDITDLKKAEKRMRIQAEIDNLTGLLNRTSFLRRLDLSLNHRRKTDGNTDCLILFDLDHFKSVNDTQGHDMGDRLLAAIGQRLKQTIRASDFAARLGGDEFALILRNIGESNCEALVERIHRKLTAPLKLGLRQFHPSVSMGVLLVGAGKHNIDEMMRKADTALFQAKKAGRNTWRNFDHDLQKRIERRRYILNGLRKAIEEYAFNIVLQPQVSLEGRKHIGFEVLARWNLDGEAISPAEFVPIAERNGIIFDIGKIIIEKAFDWHNRTRRMGIDPGMLALNISALQLKSSAFYDYLREQIAKYDMDPKKIEIELTETAIIDRDDNIIERDLKKLSELGLSISLDDFGTGNATFSHLKRYPINQLKIDRSFVDDIGKNLENTIITKAIVKLAHNLGMKVVAEGIETDFQLDFLRVCDCDIAQGYLISHPLSPEKAIDWLERNEYRKSDISPK